MQRLKLKENDYSLSNRTLRYYHFMYASALSVIAIISIVSQILIQSYLSNQQHDSHLINYAARLRTNSQSLAKFALLIETGRDYETYRKDFRTTLMQWERTHEGLLEGNEFLSLPANKNEDMGELFNIINGPYSEIMTAGKYLVDLMSRDERPSVSEMHKYIDIILKNEKAYLLGMEMIVFDYDRISRDNVEYLKRIELMLLGLALVLLLLEAMFIFTPLARRIKLTFNELIQSEKNAHKLANELQETNSVLENSHREVREINFALEKATYLVKTNAEGRIIYANDKYCHVTKYEMKELIGKPLFYNNLGGDENVIYEHIRNESRKKEVWQGEIFDHASDGTGFWLDVTLMPIVDRAGSVYQYLIIANDITNRKKTERKLRLLMEEKIRRQEEMQKIRAQSIIAGQEKERKRVAQEIHDGIGQMLTSLRMQIEMLDEKSPGSNSEVSNVNTLIHTIVNETRRICSELQPNVLEDFGLKAAVNDLVEEIKKSTGLIINVNDNYEMNVVNQEVEIGLFRIIQEAFNNIIKHSQAREVWINMESDAEYIELEIIDDGTGFEYNDLKIYDEHGSSNSHGLKNMKERAELLGATYKLQSKLGEGTRLRIELPIEEALY